MENKLYTLVYLFKYTQMQFLLKLKSSKKYDYIMQVGVDFLNIVICD